MNSLLEKMKQIRLNITAVAVITVILGIVMFFWPGGLTTAIAKLIAGIVLLNIINSVEIWAKRKGDEGQKI